VTSSAPEIAIAVRGVHKAYGDIHAVDGIDLDVAVGECVGILGPNGAGKTTTLELIEGLREPDSGEISVFGEPVWPRNLGLLPRIGVQLQTSAFFDRLSVIEQLHTFADLYGSPRSQAAHLLDMVGLSDRRHEQTSKLSGGQQQRLSIACALVHDPALVFLDEPSAGLDPTARRDLWDLVGRVRSGGRTVVLSTHFMDEAEVLCDRVAIMDAGRVLALDNPAALVRGLDAPTRVSLPPTAMTETEARGLPGVDAVEVDLGALTLTTRVPATVLAALGEIGRLDGLQVRSATLEDVFVSMTGRALHHPDPDPVSG
jgi:ABC-2 type transport system ATP-binding protein